MKKFVWLPLTFFLPMCFCIAESNVEGLIPVSVDLDLEPGTVVYLKYALFDRAGSDPSDPGVEVWQEQMDRKGVVANLKTIHVLGSFGTSTLGAVDFSQALYGQVFYRYDSVDPWMPCSARTRVPYVSHIHQEPTTVGEIKMFAVDGQIGDAWLPCDGRFLNAEDYPVLYSLIGAKYGGDGQAVFALPDLQGCVGDRYFSNLAYFICVHEMSDVRSSATDARNKGAGGFKRATTLDTHSGLEFTSGAVVYIGLNLLEHEDGVGTIWRAIPKNHDLDTGPEEILIVLAPDVVTPI